MTTTTADITPPTLTLKLAALLAVLEADAAVDDEEAEAAALPALQRLVYLFRGRIVGSHTIFLCLGFGFG